LDDNSGFHSGSDADFGFSVNAFRGSCRNYVAARRQIDLKHSIRFGAAGDGLLAARGDPNLGVRSWFAVWEANKDMEESWPPGAILC
jgi:hypothetical protein